MKPKPRLQEAQKTDARRTVDTTEIASLVDPILEKISRSGMKSLTDAERRQLERVRNRLLKKTE